MATKLLPDIFGLLKAVPAVTAILGAVPRVFRHGYAGAAPTPPYVVWLVISGDPENNLSDVPSMDRLTIEVDCYSGTDAGVEALAQAVRDALEPRMHMTGIPVDDHEPDTGLYRIGLQFDSWWSR
jgi:hypothetical protein